MKSNAMTAHLNRRTFVAGAALTAGLAATAGTALAETAPATDAAPAEADDTMDADIVIVGGGISGLSAAVQAGELGLNTVLIEAGEDVSSSSAVAFPASPPPCRLASLA